MSARTRRCAARTRAHAARRPPPRGAPANSRGGESRAKDRTPRLPTAAAAGTDSAAGGGAFGGAARRASQ